MEWERERAQPRRESGSYIKSHLSHFSFRRISEEPGLGRESGGGGGSTWRRGRPESRGAARGRLQADGRSGWGSRQRRNPAAARAGAPPSTGPTPPGAAQGCRTRRGSSPAGSLEFSSGGSPPGASGFAPAPAPGRGARGRAGARGKRRSHHFAGGRAVGGWLGRTRVSALRRTPAGSGGGGGPAALGWGGCGPRDTRGGGGAGWGRGGGAAGPAPTG